MKRFPIRGAALLPPLVIALVLLCRPLPLRAQEGFGTEEPETGDTSLPEAETSWDTGAPFEYGGGEHFEPLPRIFRSLSLGMRLEELKQTLEQDTLFHFRGDRDISFLPAREQSLVETTGSSFIRRAFFQLRDGELFVMAFSLDPGLVDHYSVFTSFVKKYGEPVLLDPRQAVWESGDTRIAIERPLTVKYIDKIIFNDILDESQVKESAAIRAREEFLNGF